jgi:prefoldin beta subunit
MMEIPEEIQGKLFQLQQYQQQMQMIQMQLQQIEMQTAEIDSALSFLSKSKEKEVYKAIGPILAKEKRADVMKSLKETKEELEIRMKTFKKQEDRIKGKVEELSEIVQKSMGQ